MKSVLSFAISSAFLVSPILAAGPVPKPERVPVQAIVTVQAASGQAGTNLQAGDVSVTVNKAPAPVTQMDRLSGDLAGMQLILLLDDSSRSASLSTHFSELRTFLRSLPPSTSVAIAYMSHGTYSLTQPFTTDHNAAANALRLPTAIPGENGSPYFALSELAKHWPSQDATTRRAALVLTDGVDRYFTSMVEDDPYVDAAVHDAEKNGIAISSIYLRGAGFYGRGSWTTTMAQSRLMQVSEETGGRAYFEGISDPVDIAPFLKDVQDRFAHQYRLTFQALNEKGAQPVSYRSESPELRVEGPTQIYIK